MAGYLSYWITRTFWGISLTLNKALSPMSNLLPG